MNQGFLIGKVVLVFAVSLVPALLIRYAIAGRPLRRAASIGITILILFLNLILFAMRLPEIGIPSAFPGISAAVSYFILRQGAKTRTGNMDMG